VFCDKKRKLELSYVVSTYFGSGRSKYSIYDLRDLYYYLMSPEQMASRKKCLGSSGNVKAFETSLLLERLCFEIFEVLESGNGFFTNQMANQTLNRDDGKDPWADEQSCCIPQFYQSAEMVIHSEIASFKSELDLIIPMTLNKLILIPHEMATDYLKMLRLTDYDTKGNYIFKNTVYSGIEHRFADHEEFILNPLLLQEFKPDHIIVYDQNNALTKSLDYSVELDPSVKVQILIGENLLEGQQMKKRDEREEEAFQQVIKSVSRWHGLSTNALDRVKVDAGLKAVEVMEKRSSAGNASNINKDGPVVVIDKREFNSDCPGMLYFQGYNVIPMFLKIGDYILDDHMVIERKVRLRL
jgi:hypothetical protein